MWIGGMMKNPKDIIRIVLYKGPTMGPFLFLIFHVKICMLSFIYFRTLNFTTMYVALIYDHNDRVYSGRVIGNSFESIEKQLKDGFYKQTTF